MKSTVLSIIFFALLGIVYADNEGTSSTKAPAESNLTLTLTGQVVDFSSGEALTGVEVQLEGTDIKTYTDFDGNFEFDNVVPGKYNIIASYISYEKSLVENFEATKQNEEIDIKLQESN
jgi:protocatechuate 3,4-dioxygenase beta subunit